LLLYTFTSSTFLHWYKKEMEVKIHFESPWPTKTFICQRKEEFSSSVMNFSFWWNFHSKSFRYCSNGICFLVRIWILSYLWLHILSFQSNQTPQTPTKVCEKLSHRMNNLLPTKRLFASCALRQNWLYSMSYLQHRLEHSICHFHAVIYSRIPQQICLLYAT